jgi:nitrogen regulatory protein P-II 2
MKTTVLKRVTIVTEAILTERMTADLLRLGASGYTITEAEGRGSRGVRASDWEGKNSKIEVVVRPEVADKIITFIADHYFPNFAVIAWMHDVEVVRGDKYE